MLNVEPPGVGMKEGAHGWYSVDTHLAKNIPVGRFGEPSEAAHCVLFLAWDEAGYITGETQNLSGGRFMY